MVGKTVNHIQKIKNNWNDAAKLKKIKHSLQVLRNRDLDFFNDEKEEALEMVSSRLEELAERRKTPAKLARIKKPVVPVLIRKKESEKIKELKLQLEALTDENSDLKEKIAVMHKEREELAIRDRMWEEQIEKIIIWPGLRLRGGRIE